MDAGACGGRSVTRRTAGLGLAADLLSGSDDWRRESGVCEAGIVGARVVDRVVLVMLTFCIDRGCIQETVLYEVLCYNNDGIGELKAPAPLDVCERHGCRTGMILLLRAQSSTRDFQ